MGEPTDAEITNFDTIRKAMDWVGVLEPLRKAIIDVLGLADDGVHPRIVGHMSEQDVDSVFAAMQIGANSDQPSLTEKAQAKFFYKVCCFVAGTVRTAEQNASTLALERFTFTGYCWKGAGFAAAWRAWSSPCSCARVASMSAA